MPIDLNRLEVGRLKSSDDVGAFLCSDVDLTSFLKVLAVTYQEEGMGVTYLAWLDGQPAGYFTVAAASLRVRGVESRDRVEGLEDMEYYPSLLIGRLGVDQRLEGQGIGSRLLQLVYGIATQERERIGVRFLILNATSDSIAWWIRRGFTPLLGQGSRRLPFLYLDVAKMER